MKLEELKGKYAFISHPFANNPEGNRKKVDKICKYWVKKGVIPISPLHMFSFYEDDSDREKILNICYKLIDIVLFVPLNSYIEVETYMMEIREAMKELIFLRKTGNETPIIVDDSKKAYTTSIEYQIIKKLEG